MYCMILPVLPSYDIGVAEPISFGLETEEDVVNLYLPVFGWAPNASCFILSNSVAAKSGFSL